MRNLERPLGAVWARNYKLTESLVSYFSEKVHECPSCRDTFTEKVHKEEINEKIVSHTLIFKITSQREKYIAVQNRRKVTNTQPDYFIHLYQADTGATPLFLFSNEAREGQTSTQMGSQSQEVRDTGNVADPSLQAKKVNPPSTDGSLGTFNASSNQGFDGIDQE